MPLEALPGALISLVLFSTRDIVEILVERGWLAADHDLSGDPKLSAWLARATELLGAQAYDRGSLASLLALVFNYDAAVVLSESASQGVLAREGSRDVIRELANRVLDGGDIDSDGFKQIIDKIKAAVPQRSRELFHPVRLALAGRAGAGELDRVILLLDSAAKLPFAVQVKSTRQRMMEFCAALD